MERSYSQQRSMVTEITTAWKLAETVVKRNENVKVLA